MAPNGLRTLLDLSICSSALPRTGFNAEDVSFGNDHFSVCLVQDNPRKDYTAHEFLCWPDICREVNQVFSTQSHLEYNIFHGTVSRAMPHNCHRCKPPCQVAPWILRCKSLFRKKKLPQKLFIQTFSSDLWVQYKKTTSTIRKTILEAKRQFWDDTCWTAKDSRIFFKTFRKI